MFVYWRKSFQTICADITRSAANKNAWLLFATALYFVIFATTPALTWRDLEWICSETGLPLVLKGILTREDALLAVEHGADAVWVSNHGGRQPDHGAAGLDELRSHSAQAALWVFRDNHPARAFYTRFGFTPDGGMTWTLPRLVGTGRARSILLQDRLIDAPTAHARGIVSDVVPDDEVRAKAERLAARLANGATTALGGIKRLLAAGEHRGLAEHVDDEAASIARSAAGTEGREGVTAFNERRKPSFHA